jgi:hypothetical protein
MSANLVAIVRATKQSAMAIRAMARHGRDLSVARDTIARNGRLYNSGRMQYEDAARSNEVHSARMHAAGRMLRLAAARYARAQAILDATPI